MLKVVFEDDALMVIDKQPGLVVTTSDTQKELSLEGYLKQNFSIQAERSGIVHRLDKDTSGLLLVAKTQSVLENLQAQFKARQVEKEYLALVHGLLFADGRIDASISRNPSNREKFMAYHGENGRQAITEYQVEQLYVMNDEVVERVFSTFNKIQIRKLKNLDYAHFSLLKCYPKTGRTHQIRVHLKYIGHPVVSDDKYGGRKMIRLDHRFCPRQFLHAAKISFIHPLTGSRVSLVSELPQDLTTALGYLQVLKS